MHYDSLGSRFDPVSCVLKIMQAHVGSRGGSALLEHFEDLANAGKMDAPTLKICDEFRSQLRPRQSDGPERRELPQAIERERTPAGRDTPFFVSFVSTTVLLLFVNKY